MEWVKELKTGTAWGGHMEWARNYVKEQNAETILELGVYGGHSLLSLAQGLKDNGIKGKVIGVDTWRGDKNVGHYEGKEMQDAVQFAAEKYFPDIEIKLINKTFDKARYMIKNNSVDILHIDGQHDYESVRKDFDNYIGKVKPGGTVLMHDTQETGGGFEVHKVFAELKEEYPEWRFDERIESHGLGIIKLA